MDSFLVRAEPLGICGGWHDVGHARIKELAGGGGAAGDAGAAGSGDRLGRRVRKSGMA